MSGICIAPKYSSFRDAVSYVGSLVIRPREAVVALSRHGQTKYNLKNKLQPWDPDHDRLSKKGKCEARNLGTPLKQLPINWVASSDQARALQTAQFAVPFMPISAFRCLRDYDYGMLGGMTYSGSPSEFEKDYPDEFRVWRDDRMNFSAPGGEKYPDFQARVRRGFSEQVLSRCAGKTSFIVSHKSTIREILLSTVYGSTIGGDNFPIDGTGLTIIRFRSDGSPELLLLNNLDHLA
jgi:broad specificity phosphatase PhoE